METAVWKQTYKQISEINGLLNQAAASSIFNMDNQDCLSSAIRLTIALYDEIAPALLLEMEGNNIEATKEQFLRFANSIISTLTDNLAPLTRSFYSLRGDETIPDEFIGNTQFGRGDESMWWSFKLRATKEGQQLNRGLALGLQALALYNIRALIQRKAKDSYPNEFDVDIAASTNQELEMVQENVHNLKTAYDKVLFIKYTGIYESLCKDPDNQRNGQPYKNKIARIISYMIGEEFSNIKGLMPYIDKPDHTNAKVLYKFNCKLFICQALLQPYPLTPV